jgi:hypothetical protein
MLNITWLSKAKLNTWLSKCAGIVPQNNEISCYGTLFKFYESQMLKLQRLENNELTSIDMQQIYDTNLNKTLHFELNPIWLYIKNINCNVASDI